MLDLDKIKLLFKEIKRLNSEDTKEGLDDSQKREKDNSNNFEDIEGFMRYVDQFNPRKILSVVKIFLFNSENNTKEDIRSFGKIIDKANKNLRYDQSKGTNLVVQFIIYKIILVALHRYIRSIPELQKQKNTIDVFFKGMSLLGISVFLFEFQLSFADNKVREFYYNITSYVVRFFFDEDGEKNYTDKEIVTIVNNIVEEYENICRFNRSNDIEFSELIVLTKCIVESFLNEYSENYFNFPVIDKDYKDESFEDAILGIAHSKDDIISLPKDRFNIIGRDYDDN